MATYTSQFSERIRKALRVVGLGVAPAATTADSSVPLITAGSGAASASDPNGSLRLRTDGVPEFRVGSAWTPPALASQAFASTAALTTTRGVASGTALKVGGLAHASIAASTAITGATETETLFSTQYSLPADSLAAATVIRIRAQGIYTATTGAETHSLILKIGTIAITTMALVDPADNDIFYFDCILICRTAGATGTCVATGTQLSQAATGVGTAKPFFLASTTIDTTAANIIGVAIDRQGTATDSDSARLDILTVEVVG